MSFPISIVSVINFQCDSVLGVFFLARSLQIDELCGKDSILENFLLLIPLIQNHGRDRLQL